MSIKVNLEFVKESKELIEGIERLTRLLDDKLEIENIQIYQVEGRAKAKIIYKSDNLDYCMNYFTCKIHKGTLEHYFNVKFNKSSIYENVGDFGFTPDQVLYLKYGNQNLYIVEKDGMFDEVGAIFSETELREWFRELWLEEFWESNESDPRVDSDYFDEWLKTTVSNGYLKMYLLFDVGNIKYPWEE